jgi:hypothetical protein
MFHRVVRSYAPLVAVVVLLIAVASPLHYANADDYTIKFTALGCQKRELFDKAVGFQVAKDTEAFKSFALAAVLSGECIFFSPGDIVFLEDVKVFSGVTCLRPKGQINCFWTYSEIIK